MIRLGPWSLWVWKQTLAPPPMAITNEAPADGALPRVGKDFDFYGATAKVADAINEEHMIFSRQAPKKSTVAQAKEVNLPDVGIKSPDPIPDLQPEMSLWSTSIPATQVQQTPQYHITQQEPLHQPSALPKRLMTLEEVEAQILASQRPTIPSAPSHPTVSHPNPPVPQVRALPPLSEPPQLQQFNPDLQLFPPPPSYLSHGATPPPPQFPPAERLSPQPRGPFNQNRPLLHLGSHSPGLSGLPTGPGAPPIAQFQQREADRARLLEEESRRLKRNHKIAQLVLSSLIEPNF